MLHDPTDETHRKPRQLRNTPLQKYVRLTSLFITLLYAGAMYISWRRHRNDPKVLKEFEELKASAISEGQRSLFEDYAWVPHLRGKIERLFERQEAGSKAEEEREDTQANV